MRSLLYEHLPLLIVSPLLAAIVVIDQRTKRIPDVLSLGALALTSATVSMLAISSETPVDARGALLGATILAGVMGGLHTVRPDGLGMGDVKLALTLGLLLGWTRSDALAVLLMVAWTLMAASLIGLATVAQEVRRSRDPVRTVAIPFGPALCLGSTMVVLVGPPLLPS